MPFVIHAFRETATKDIDLRGYGSPDVGRLEAIFREVCAVAVQDDGLVFAAATVKAQPIREEAVYDGIRVTFEAKLGTAKVPVQVDVGFGDATTPPPELVEILAFANPDSQGAEEAVPKVGTRVELGRGLRVDVALNPLRLLRHHARPPTQFKGTIRAAQTRKPWPKDTYGFRIPMQAG